MLVLGAFGAGLMAIAIWQTWQNDLDVWILPSLVVVYGAMLLLALTLMWRNILFEIEVPAA